MRPRHPDELAPSSWTISLLFFVLLSLGCQGKGAETLKEELTEVASGYLSASVEGKYEEVYAMASASFRAEVDKDSYIRSARDHRTHTRLLRFVIHNSEVISEQMGSVRATVTYEKKGPGFASEWATESFDTSLAFVRENGKWRADLIPPSKYLH